MNTDYEGEIKQKGDTVQIRTTPSITIRDYQVGGGLTYEKPTSDKVELQIDQAKYFAFEVNDVDAYQADIKLMDDWSDDAGQQMKIEIDTDLLGRHYADAAAENAGATAGAKSGSYNLGAAGAPVAITKANVLDVLVDCGSVLDEQNAPETGRYVILPAWMNGMLKKSDLRDASAMGDSTSVFRNGKVGMLDRFTVFISNNLSVVTDATTTRKATNVFFGHKKALTFASQMTEMETLPNPSDFGKLVRGLNVYGSKVIDPDACGHLYAERG
nr:P22 phage major capsid protein family protein [uncultured Halomonas sp.]